MSTTEEDDYDWKSTDSNIVIRVRATKKEPLPGGRDELYFVTEGDMEHHIHLGASLLNVDYYLQPPADLFYDFNSEFRGATDDAVFYTGFSDYEFAYNLYEDELRRAAHQRAQEDSTHAVNVLAEWLWLAGGADHVSRADAGIFYRALADEVREVTAPEWALAHDGTPDGWMNDHPPVTTLSEAKTYLDGGYAAVIEEREDDG